MYPSCVVILVNKMYLFVSRVLNAENQRRLYMQCQGTSSPFVVFILCDDFVVQGGLQFIQSFSERAVLCVFWCGMDSWASKNQSMAPWPNSVNCIICKICVFELPRSDITSCGFLPLLVLRVGALCLSLSSSVVFLLSESLQWSATPQP